MSNNKKDDFSLGQMTNEEIIENESLKLKNASFDSALFGDLSVLKDFVIDDFIPEVTPKKGEHPRLMFKKPEIPAIREKIADLKSRSLTKTFYEISERKDIVSGVAEDGNVKTLELMAIEAMAFRYVLEENEVYAQRALFAIKNSMLQVKVTWGDAHRYYGMIMQAASDIYDWCYDILTEKDRSDLLCGMLNLLAKKFEIGCPPWKESIISHHNCEDQLLRNYVAMSIAIYDEAPEVYNYVFRRLIRDYKPSSDFLLQTGTHWEGAQYGCMRIACLVWSQFLISNLTDGQFKVFNEENLRKSVLSYLWIRLPSRNDTFFDIGDIWGPKSLAHMALMAALGSLYFHDSNLYALAWETCKIGIDGHIDPLLDYIWVSPVMYLLGYDKSKDTYSDKYGTNVPLAYKMNYPKSAVLGRSSWNSDDAFAVYMTMNEVFTASHSHMEAGSFQIYYKGLLASDSGSYDCYGSLNYFGYSFQTIASNSVLVYNPEIKDSWSVYSGGQSIQHKFRQWCPFNVNDLKNEKHNWQAEIFGKAISADNKKFDYAYLAGDMTSAYDSETVDEVVRHLISVKTDDAKHPMVFVTYDRITAKKPEFKKTILLHSHAKPSVDGKNVIIDNGKGKLVSQILFTDINVSMYGLDIENPEDVAKPDAKTAYEVNGKLLNPTRYSGIRGIDYRIDFCPKKASSTDKIINVMYVCDSENNDKVVAKELENNEFIGTVILEKAILFAKDVNDFSASSTITLPNGTNQCFVGGLKAGKWKVDCNSCSKTLVVKEDEALLVIDNPNNIFTITYLN